MLFSQATQRLSALTFWVVLGGTLFALIWSLSFVVTRLALDEIPPVLLAAIRLTLSGTMLMALRLRAAAELWRSSPSSARQTILLSGLLSQAVYLGACYWALTAIPTSIVNIFVSSLPLLTIPAAFLVLQERAGPLEILAVLMGVAGVAIAVFDADTMGAASGAYLLAVLLLVVAVASLALGNTLIKRIVSTRNFLEVCALQFLSAGLALLLLAPFLEAMPSLASVVRAIPELAYLVLFGSILGTAIWFRLLTVLTANQAASFFLLTPIMGILLGSLVFGEPLTLAKLFGVLVLVTSIALKVLVTFQNNS
ncbi:DMT family transporter [Afifella pfennigii]|uniref:DMT family transporter n=1 Tax=Afifella pfennigii TaxID=209897 RepID=UPI00047D972D|nr:DMT family transporter [Afifella pfennigii]